VLEVCTAVGRRPADLLDRDNGGGAPPPRAAARLVVGCQVVIDDHRLDLDPLVDRLIARESEVDDVARVVLHHVHDTASPRDGVGSRLDLDHRRARKDPPWDRRVEHASPDETGMQRLVPRAAAGDHRDARPGIVVGAHDEARGAVPAHNMGIGTLQPRERLRDESCRVV
jgi:hypothetical protein